LFIVLLPFSESKLTIFTLLEEEEENGGTSLMRHVSPFSKSIDFERKKFLSSVLTTLERLPQLMNRRIFDGR
jgi:hypothetical protein